MMLSQISGQSGTQQAHTIMVINAKGGCGKTTIATNLAAYYAAQKIPTVLRDYDSQGSSMRWLTVRPDNVPPVHGTAAFQAQTTKVTRSWQLRTPEGTQRIISDTCQDQKEKVG